MGRGFAATCACAGLALLVGCGRASAGETPESTVQRFFELVSLFDGNPRDADRLFEMVSERARRNLRMRSERYGAASGRTISASAMLVPSRMVLRFEPHSYDAQVVGQYAMVDVIGVDPARRAQVPCVYEEGKWRIDLVLPELAPLRVGPGHKQ